MFQLFRALPVLLVFVCTVSNIPAWDAVASGVHFDAATVVAQAPAVPLKRGNQPGWLLILGQDVPDPGGGSLRISPMLSANGYVMKSYEPATDPLTVTFLRDGRILYRKGKGEITRGDTTVVLPLR